MLILDDIFSALDAHTGEHVYRHALVGLLAAGRTRILATHHASLCLGQADYSVVLENGCAKYAGPVDESFWKAENECSLDENDSGFASSTQNAEFGDGQTTSPPTAFTQDETRGKGSIKLSLWATYVRMGGPILWWILVISGYLGYVLFYFGRVSLVSSFYVFFNT